jgi:predicted DNA-binding transcriptional regulator AlpA
MDDTRLPELMLGIEGAKKARGCKSPTTIWAEVRDGTFPPPDKIIKRVRYWRASTLCRWQDSNIGVNAV